MQGNWDHSVLPKETEFLQVVTFRLNEEEFAFDLSRVKEIIRMGEITRVPRAPDYIAGVFNLRGNIIPIIHLKKRFGWEIGQYSAATRIVVVEAASVISGIVVDSVQETRKLPVTCLEAPSALVMGSIDNEYIPGVAKLEDRLLILLDIKKILHLKKE